MGFSERSLGAGFDFMDRVFDPVGRPERPLALGATSQSTGILASQIHRYSNLSAHPHRILADILHSVQEPVVGPRWT